MHGGGAENRSRKVAAAVGAHDDEVEVPVCKARELEVGLADKELRLDIEAATSKGSSTG